MKNTKALDDNGIKLIYQICSGITLTLLLALVNILAIYQLTLSAVIINI